MRKQTELRNRSNQNAKLKVKKEENREAESETLNFTYVHLLKLFYSSCNALFSNMLRDIYPRNGNNSRVRYNENNNGKRLHECK